MYCSYQVCREAALKLIAETISIFEQPHLQQQEQQAEMEQAESGDDATPGAAALRKPRQLTVLVQQGCLYNAWGQEHLRTKFPTWEELKGFDPV